MEFAEVWWVLDFGLNEARSLQLLIVQDVTTTVRTRPTALTALVDVTLALDESVPCIDATCTVPGSAEGLVDTSTA